MLRDPRASSITLQAEVPPVATTFLGHRRPHPGERGRYEPGRGEATVAGTPCGRLMRDVSARAENGVVAVLTSFPA